MESATATALSKVAGDVELEAQYNRLSRRLQKYRPRRRSALVLLSVALGLFLVAVNASPFPNFEVRIMSGGAAPVCFISAILSLRSSNKYSLYPENTAFVYTVESINDLDKSVLEHDSSLIERALRRMPKIRAGVLNPFESRDVYLLTKNTIVEPSNKLNTLLTERFKPELIVGGQYLVRL